MGVCKTLRRVDKPEDLTEALRQVLHEARWRNRAQFWSERIADRGVGNALERTVEGCLRLVS